MKDKASYIRSKIQKRLHHALWILNLLWVNDKALYDVQVSGTVGPRALIFISLQELVDVVDAVHNVLLSQTLDSLVHNCLMVILNKTCELLGP